jgi:hypothetical protein
VLLEEDTPVGTLQKGTPEVGILREGRQVGQMGLRVGQMGLPVGLKGPGKN